MNAGLMLPTARSRPAAVGYAILTLGALMWSSSTVLAKGILETGFDVTALAQLRATIAALILTGIVLVIRPQALRLRRHEVLPLALMGVFGIALTQFLIYMSVRELPVGIAMLVQFTAPLMIAVWFRVRHREVVKNMVWVGLALSIASLALVGQIWKGFTLSITGVAFALASAAVMSVYYIKGDALMRREDRRDPLSLAMWAFIFAAAFWATIKPWWLFPFDDLFVPAQPFGANGPTLPMLALIAWVVVVGTIATAPLIPLALRYVDGSQASMIGMIEPILAGGMAWIALGEQLGPFQILGAFGVLAGIALAERSRAGKPLLPRRRRLIPMAEPDIPIVVIGGDAAGLHAVHELRRSGITSPITIIGTEPLTEEIPAVTFEPSVSATHVDTRSGTIRLSDGRSISTRGIIATNGARPWEVEVPGPRGGVRAVYTPQDIGIALADTSAHDSMLIIGGTAVGSELGARACQTGMNVTIVTQDSDLMTKALGDVLGGIATSLHRKHGVRVICGRIPVEFLGDEHGYATGVVLDDGTRIDADVIVQAGGEIPIAVVEESSVNERTLTGLLRELARNDNDHSLYTWTSTQYDVTFEGWGSMGFGHDVQIITEVYNEAGRIDRLIAALWDKRGLTGVIGINATESLADYRNRLTERRRRSALAASSGT